MPRLIGSLARVGCRAIAATAAAQVAPAASWIPSVRGWFPRLAGRGRPDHVALTFDDGPDPESTPAFLDILSARGVRATFFVVGERVGAQRSLMRRIVAEGHEIAVHGWRHRYALASSPRLGGCVAAIESAAGVRPLWFRPPYGVLSSSALVEARLAGLAPVLWTAWAKDWTRDATASSVQARLEPGIVGGATLLLHDAGSSRSATSWTATHAALPAVLDCCASRGLAIGPLRDHGLIRPRHDPL